MAELGSHRWESGRIKRLTGLRDVNLNLWEEVLCIVIFRTIYYSEVITCGGGPPGQLVPNTPPRANVVMCSYESSMLAISTWIIPKSCYIQKFNHSHCYQ
ncbi:predicted protein [Histoplasma mississippiense (nom. inval.)]|uniref:predicted protein n=1 Tax=Ajellomyces capsulatus (strain NAm1 / WU24) TaxID=2059318 RepID=UPI000157D2C2|nr:predicted protein [Histoplasma mississippiense (nom. inval.)]EDN04755.1 predicted protein [Histoplasma mississippiense (nom. inval.)]